MTYMHAYLLMFGVPIGGKVGMPHRIVERSTPPVTLLSSSINGNVPIGVGSNHSQQTHLLSLWTAVRCACPLGIHIIPTERWGMKAGASVLPACLYKVGWSQKDSVLIFRTHYPYKGPIYGSGILS